jgi:hypothetical protein
MTPENDRLRASIAVLQHLVTLLYEQSPNKAKVLIEFRALSDGIANHILYSDESEEFRSAYLSNVEVALQMLETSAAAKAPDSGKQAI